jgi:protein SCO1/2
MAFLGLNAAGLLVGGARSVFADVAAAPMPPAREAPRSERMKRHFPNVPLQTHDGRSVRFYDDLVKGKKVIINFTFTTCQNTCSATSSNLARVQRMLGERAGRDVFFVSLTLDPEHDTPEILKQYAETVRAQPGWTFATGRAGDIDDIRRRLGLYDGPDFTRHMGLLTFGNEPEGKWASTPALDTPRNILYSVLRRVDPFVYTPWPAPTER